MSARRLLVLLCGLAVLAVRLPAAEPAGDLPKGHLDGYVALVNADRARDRGQYKAALQAYREARLQYQRVGRENPAWHPEIVQYRLTYCSNQIDALLKQAGKTEAELMSEPEAAVDGDLARTRSKYADLMKEHTAAQTRLAELESTVKRTQGDVLARDGEIARLREDINRARDQLLASTNTMAAANQLAQNVVGSLEEETRRLKTELQAQSDAGRLAAQEYRRLQTEMEAFVLADAKVREDLAAAQAKLEQTGRVAKDSGTELAALRKEVVELRARDQAHNAELKKRDDQLALLKTEGVKQADERNAAVSALAQREKAAATVEKDLAAARLETASLKMQVAALEQRQRSVQDDAEKRGAGEVKARADLAAAVRDADAVRQEAANLKAQLTALEQKLRVAQGDVERLALAEAKAREELAPLARRRDELTAELAKVQGERDLARTDLEKQARNLAGREAALANWDKDRAGLTQDLARARTELATAQAAVKAAEGAQGASEKLAKELAQVREQAAAARQEADRKGQELTAVRAELSKATAEVEPLRKAAADRQKADEKLRNELAGEQARADQLAASVKGARDEAEARTRMHEALLENHRALQKRLADVSAERDAADTARRALETAQKQLEAELAGLRKGDSPQLTAARDALAKAQQDLAREQKRATALSETVDARGRELAEVRPLKDQLKEAQSEITKLKEEKRVQKLEQIVTDLRGQLKAVQDELVAAQATMARQEQKLKSYQSR